MQGERKWGGGGVGRDEKELGDHRFILIWIVAQKSKAIKWEWLFSKGVLKSLGEPKIARLDTVFVM